MSALLIIILVLLLIMVLTAGVILGAAFLGTRKVKRAVTGRQELVPGHKSVAPLNWTGSPKKEALLHRRLVTAMTLARSVQHPDVSEAMGRQAILIEHELVRTALLRGDARKAGLNTMESLVSSIEELARGEYERSTAAPAIQTDLSELRERLQLLEEARRELG